MIEPDEQYLRQRFKALLRIFNRHLKDDGVTEKEILDYLIASCFSALENDHDLRDIAPFYMSRHPELEESVTSFLYALKVFRSWPSVVASLKDITFNGETEKITNKRKKHSDSHSERRKKGRYYTPLKIADFMARLAIEKYMEIHKSEDSCPKILDPSVGGGIFLDAIINMLLRYEFEIENILRNITAIDLDEDSISSVRKVLNLRLPEKSGLKSKLIVGDFLLDNIKHPQNGYDIIIGNPPYISFYSRESESDDETKSQLAIQFAKKAGGSINTFLMFITKAIELLADGGILCFIIPDKILWNRRYEKARQSILESAPPIALYTLGEGVFSDATMGSSIICLCKGASYEMGCFLASLQLNKLFLDTTDPKSVNFDDFKSQPETRFTVRDPLMARIEEGTIPLEEIADVRDGINLGFRAFRESVVSEKKHGKTYRPLIEGMDVHPFEITRRELYINYDPALLTRELKSRGVSFRKAWIFDSPRKLVSRQTSDHLIFALDENQLYDLNSVHNTILKADIDERVLDFLLILMNSRLMNYYYRCLSCETGRTFPQVHIADLRVLPVKMPNSGELERFDELAAKLLNPKIDKKNLLSILDEMIFDLYDLNQSKKIKIINATGMEWRN